MLFLGADRQLGGEGKNADKGSWPRASGSESCLAQGFALLTALAKKQKFHQLNSKFSLFLSGCVGPQVSGGGGSNSGSVSF